ncbi:MAG: Flp pilus assembly complex ATPase component TadA [Clostridiales bacterium]|nr:Flp pilus assembly complex ATPase component TadA [Clostridiales bacterium]
MEQTMEKRFDSAARGLSDRIRKCLKGLPADMKNQTQELRLRVNRPVSVCCNNGIYFLTRNGRLACLPEDDMVLAGKEDLEESFRNICSYSVYSHQSEIKSGYVTLCGGHRVGISGTAVLRDGQISGMRDISSINIRIAREIPGAADELLKMLKDTINAGLLLAGAPASGKTTILRDIARQLSSGINGNMRKVAVVDERGELAGTYLGVPQNDMGLCSDVLDGYPKAEGILQAVRSLSPEFILCDEIGGNDEVNAVVQGLNAGAGVISSIHAGSIEQLMKRKQAVDLLRTGAFGTVAMLDGYSRPGKITGIYRAGDLLAEIDGSADSDRLGNARGICGVA